MIKPYLELEDNSTGLKLRYSIMKKLNSFLITILFSMVFITPAHSALKKVGQAGLPFLKVDMSARAAAMGGAFMVVGEDANAMFYNPAGVAKMDKSFDFTAGQTQWIAGITYNSTGLVKNFGNWGNFGLSAIYCSYGDIEGTIVMDNNQGFERTGNVDVSASAFGLSYARNLSSKFTVGGQIKWVSQHLGSSVLNDGSTVKNAVSDLAYDFGTIFYPGFKSFRFGMSIRNFSRELRYQKEGFQLPLTFTIGAAIDLMDFVNVEGNSLLLAVDAIHPRDYSERLHVGVEYKLMDMFSLRAGYKYNYDEEGITLGAGLQKSLGRTIFRIDYAYAPMDFFDTVNRITVGISF